MPRHRRLAQIHFHRRLVLLTMAAVVALSSCGAPEPDVTLTPSRSTPATLPTPTESVTPSETPSLAQGEFPTAATTGVPEDWEPAIERNGDFVIDKPGTIIEDARLTGGVLYIRADNVTLRRVELVNARVSNVWNHQCFNGLVIEDSTILRGDSDIAQPAVEAGGYTATRVKIDGPSEGFRASGYDFGCDPVLIEDSWIHVEPADGCHGDSWHGDGIQGYFAPSLTVRNTRVALGGKEGCVGNSPFFYPNQKNTEAHIEGLLIEGGGFGFRLETPGSVENLKIVADSWEYGPMRVTSCDDVEWGEGNEVVKEKDDGTLTSVEPLECTP